MRKIVKIKSTAYKKLEKVVDQLKKEMQSNPYVENITVDTLCSVLIEERLKKVKIEIEQSGVDEMIEILRQQGVL